MSHERSQRHYWYSHFSKRLTLNKCLEAILCYPFTLIKKTAWDKSSEILYSLFRKNRDLYLFNSTGLGVNYQATGQVFIYVTSVSYAFSSSPSTPADR